METRPNFIIGHGERLIRPIAAPGGGGSPTAAYSFLEARDRIAPKALNTSAGLDELPASACPNGESVALLTLHPQSVAKSYYPGALLEVVGLTPVGSRATTVKPEKWTRKGVPQPTLTTQIYVSALRERLRRWAGDLPTWHPDHRGADDLPRIEDLRALTVQDRLRPMPGAPQATALEAVLHAPSESDYVLSGFEGYCRTLDLVPELDRRIQVGGLCFVPLLASREALEELARFSFLRVLRQLPTLRPLPTVTRAVTRRARPHIQLPDEDALNPDVRVAVLDGGIRNVQPLQRWVTLHDAPPINRSLLAFEEHGTAVTSGVLFGPISSGTPLDRPFAKVDHYRVLDERTGSDFELYDVLNRIQDILQTNTYELVNLSVGPDSPVEDDDVHVWTAVLDEILADGNTLITVAVGNEGEADEALGLNRIQAPADCVNALAVGAADSQGDGWSRAPYSAIGPGRSPGVVKPDVVAFGGVQGDPFLVLEPSTCASVLGLEGTSFAAPSVMRLAAGMRAHFGTLLRPLSLKALIINAVSGRADDERRFVGWGRVPSGIAEIVTCAPGTARIVYQGMFDPARYVRAPVPLPADVLEGNVTIRATFCYATRVDPQDPGNYTRSGLDVVFRPHSERLSGDLAQSRPFFQRHDYSTEQELRQDAHKWETALHAEHSFRGASLQDPVFDIHYGARLGGAPDRQAAQIPYALVVTITSRRTPDLYNRIMQRYTTQLEELRPMIEIPILAQP